MINFLRIRAVMVRMVFAMGLCGLISCQAPSSTSGGAAPSSSSLVERAESQIANGPVRDLSQDEAAGGHILRKHVGQTDEQLRQRLDREPRITGASTYTDRPAAEQAVGAAIATSQDRIQLWLGRSGGHPNLALDYDSPSPIGRTMNRNRGESQARPCAHALVVLKYSGPGQYYVLTSYPECR